MTTKNIAITLALFFLSLTSLEATSIEIRGNVFYHTSKKFHRVYGSCAPDLQLQLSAPILSNNLGVWGNFSWSPKKGSCGCGDDYTRSRIYNSSVGFNYTIPQILNTADVYVGLGLSVSAVTLNNKSCCVNERVTNYAAGAMVKSGFITRLTSNYYLNLFGDYLYQPISYSGNAIDVGGLKLGMGIGYDF